MRESRASVRTTVMLAKRPVLLQKEILVWMLV